MANRLLQDADATVKKSVALPNAANTTSTASIDLGADPFNVSQSFTVKLSTTAGTGANSKNINIRLMHSSESNANFTNISEIANPLLRITESGSSYAASTAETTLPPSIKRYLRVAALGEANGGDASGGTLTMQLNY
jgi:hypothetical protein